MDKWGRNEVAKDYIAGIINGTSVKIVDEAQVAKQVARGRGKKAIIGAAIGLVIGAGIVVLFYFTHDEIDNQKWFGDVYPDYPILATIPDAKEDSGKYGYYRKKKYGYGYGYGYGVSKGYYGAHVGVKKNNNVKEEK